MATQFDEKGKIFTQIVSKHPVPVIIQTSQNQIRGSIHIRPNARIKDELSGPEHFMAVTDAVVYDLQNQEQYRTSFMVVNANHISWVIPEENLAK
jgi:hypothetical protein